MKKLSTALLTLFLLAGCIATDMEPGHSAYLYTWNDRENPIATFVTNDATDAPAPLQGLLDGAILSGDLLLQYPNLDTRSATPYLLKLCSEDVCQYSVLFPAYFSLSDDGKVGGFAAINDLTTAFYYEVMDRPKGEVKYYLDQMAISVVRAEVEGFADDLVDYRDIATLDFSGFYNDRFLENLYDTTFVERAVSAIRAGNRPTVSNLLAGDDGSVREEDAPEEDSEATEDQGDSNEDQNDGSDTESDSSGDADSSTDQSVIVEGCNTVTGFSGSYAACPGGSTFELEDCEQADDGSLTCRAPVDQEETTSPDIEQECSVVEYDDANNIYDGGTGYGYLCPNGATYHPYECQTDNDAGVTCAGYEADTSNCLEVTPQGPAFCFIGPEEASYAPEYCVVAPTANVVGSPYSGAGIGYFCPDGQEYSSYTCDVVGGLSSCGGYPIGTRAEDGQARIDCARVDAWGGYYSCPGGLIYTEGSCFSSGADTYSCSQ